MISGVRRADCSGRCASLVPLHRDASSQATNAAGSSDCLNCAGAALSVQGCKMLKWLMGLCVTCLKIGIKSQLIEELVDSAPKWTQVDIFAGS